jgi:hypothetical protein
MFHDAPHYFAFRHMHPGERISRKVHFELTQAAVRSKVWITLWARHQKTEEP